MARVELKNLTKVFEGNVRAVDDVCLEIHDGEFMVLVGPSGCGKTTTLRMIAGLESVSRGQVVIGNRVVNRLAPKDRDVAMVFQNYALYPHLSVFENLAFGLRMRRTPAEVIRQKVHEIAQLLDLDQLLSRRPYALSGGQQQRVALGRAIVRDPKAFLYDEPLSNLDAKLRAQLRAELKTLHRRLRTTAIYVTHDQSEAMTLGDRICVMYNGKIQQVGTPMGLYHEPANQFVAGFVGLPAMNFISGEINRENGRPVFKTSFGKIDLTDERQTNLDGRQVQLGVRPQYLSLSPRANSDGHIKAVVQIIEPLGDRLEVQFITDDKQTIVANLEPEVQIDYDQERSLYVDGSAVHLFESDTLGRRIE